MRAWLLAALVLLTPALVGCIGDEDETSAGLERARLACLQGICNFQATVDPLERQANELSIAVNPTDPRNMLASGKDYNPAHAGDCVWDGVYVTKDGGLTWKNMNLPGSNWYRLNVDPAYEPHPDFSRFWCATDPVLAFGPDGTAYWTVMPYQCDAVSGSKTGREFVPGTGVGLPQGGFNDWFWTCSSMYVLVSEDGGETWPIVREVAFGPRLEHDKQWMAVSPEGTVLLCWDRDPNYQLSGGTPAEQLNHPGGVVCATSSDKGRTWTDPVWATGEWDGFLPWVDYAADEHAWMAALDAENILVSHSENGLSWEQPWVVGSYENPPPGGEYGWPVVEGSDFRIFALPAIAVDRTEGPCGGTVYVTWFDHSSGDGEVLLTTSRDHGATWSEPKRVHDDAPDSGFDQYMPAVSVGPDGTMDIIWYDRRDDPNNHLMDLYYTYSLDCGETLAPNLRVSEVSTDEQYSHHQNGMIFLGDYIDLDSTEGRAHAVWVDTRNQKADAFVATIERPSANAP